MLRELIDRFNRSLSNQMVPHRRRFTAPMKVWFDALESGDRARDLARTACIHGETVDMSRSGMGFVVPSIRLKEKYLVGQDRKLNIEIDLPSGRVHLKALGRRYAKVGKHISAERFLVGVEIVGYIGDDKMAYESFLKNGSRTPRAAGLEFGVDS